MIHQLYYSLRTREEKYCDSRDEEIVDACVRLYGMDHDFGTINLDLGGLKHVLLIVEFHVGR